MACGRFVPQIARRHRAAIATPAPRARSHRIKVNHVTPIVADEVNTRAMSDADDVRRVLAGDVDAFAALVDRYYDRCARFAVRMLGNRDDAEDALQATFLRAYRALGRYQERDKFSAWLYRILVNQCRSLAARRSHRERVFVREEAAMANAPDEVPDWTGESEEWVQRVLSELDPLLREAFLLKYVEELSYEEMSALTGASVSALKMRVKRACDRLRGRWDEIKDA
jgi:RNA polymerase sigma-70 factor (ECF subfamily)